MVSSSAGRCVVVSAALLVCVAVLAYAFSIAWTPDPYVPSTNGPRVTQSLKFLIVISRHGNRRSYSTFPNDPYPLNDTAHWPYGLGELTTHGRLQMYNLGLKIRSLYSGFLKAEYYGSDVYASSTAIDRTLMSGEAFLAGLYPPKGFQLWNRNVLWQPVPIYSDSLDKTVVAFSCPRFVQERAMNKQKFEEEYADNLTAVNGYISQYAGANLTGGTGLFTSWDTFISEDTEGYTLPEWTKPVYPEPMTFLAGRMYVAYIGGSIESTRLIIGQFLNEMIGVMEGKVNGTLSPDRKLYYYSGHDTSIVTLQVAMGIPKQSVIGMVMPGSAMVFELHQNKNTSKFSVQSLYIDGRSASLDPVPLNIPDCGDPCDFYLLANNLKPFANVTNYDEECQVIPT